MASHEKQKPGCLRQSRFSFCYGIHFNSRQRLRIVLTSGLVKRYLCINFEFENENWIKIFTDEIILTLGKVRE